MHATHLDAEVAVLAAVEGVRELLHVIVLGHQPRRQQVLERVNGVDERRGHARTRVVAATAGLPAARVSSRYKTEALLWLTRLSPGSAKRPEDGAVRGGAAGRDS